MSLPLQDPLADGPTIQAAGTRALAAGCTLDKVQYSTQRKLIIDCAAVQLSSIDNICVRSRQYMHGRR